MKKYSEYKDSGVEWIGEIPSSWNLLKMGRSFANISSGTTPKSTDTRYYLEGTINWLNTGDLTDSYVRFTKKKITEFALSEFSTLKKYPVDSVVIALYGATIGKIGQLTIETTTNQACCVISESDNIQQRYLFYYFLAARNYIISMAYGGGQPNISQDVIKQLYIPTPSLPEQTQIARYLDHQTGLIDAIIEKKEKLIIKLKEQRQAIINEAVTKGLNPNPKMKDSGIEWLGEIPEHWEVVRLKYITNHSTEKGDGLSDFKIALENIESKTGKLIFSESKDFEGELKFFKKGNILFNKLRPYLSKVLIAPRSGECVSELLVFEPNNRFVDSSFLFYRLSSEQIISIVDSSTYGAKMPRASIDFILNLPIPIAPKLEQYEISSYLENKTNKIENLISRTEIIVKKLKSYRQSIISEAVTGKIDVRDWQPKTDSVVATVK